MSRRPRIPTMKPRLKPCDQRTAKPAPSTGPKQLYGTAAWAKLVMRLKRERGDRCEDPTHEGSNQPGERRVIADHIVEVQDGGAELDPANILLRCMPCHVRKTNTERAKRLAAPLT